MIQSKNKVKLGIICTLGPASSRRTVLEKMMLAGMDVCRINFSHVQGKESFSKIKLIKSLREKSKRNLKILGDLQGHRIRISNLARPLKLQKGQIVRLVQEGKKAGRDVICFDYQGSLSPIKKGYNIFIDDGNIALKVKKPSQGNLKAEVLVGGLLRTNKGVNIPQAKLDFGGISLKDKKDIKFCQENHIEYLAQSFVCSQKDVLEVKNILGGKSQIKIFAKIENREGINNIDSIIKAADGIMVARGDMGVSLPIYQIPVVQKMIIKKCNRAKKPVITATQMLESMTENIRPTRAEVTDVANAVIDGTDFVMLSAETAIGKYPVKTVQMTSNIIKFTQKSLFSN